MTQESSLFFKGRNIDTKSVDYRAYHSGHSDQGAADIAEGVTLGGKGILSLESGGRISIQGTVESDEQSFSPTVQAEFRSATPQRFLEHLDFPQWQVPELISRESKLSPWAYTLRTRFKTLALCGAKSDGRIGLLTLKFTELINRACSHRPNAKAN